LLCVSRSNRLVTRDAGSNAEYVYENCAAMRALTKDKLHGIGMAEISLNEPRKFVAARLRSHA